MNEEVYVSKEPKVKPHCFGSCNEECWSMWKGKSLSCFPECCAETKCRNMKGKI